VMRPKAMLFDEPTSALDVELVREVLDVMEGLARDGMTMVVVSHELRFAHHVASSILMMDEGQIIEEAPPDKFFTAPAHERTRRQSMSGLGSRDDRSFSRWIRHAAQGAMRASSVVMFNPRFENRA